MKFSKKQIKVLSWWCAGSKANKMSGIIADGAIRSGKTLCMSLSFMLWAMENFSGENFLICGRSIGAVRRNITNELVERLCGLGYNIFEKKSENLIECRMGEHMNRFYLFGGAGASRTLVQGITAAGALFDEVAVMDREFVEQACARCSREGAKLWFCCNPEGLSNWFYEDWIKKAAEKSLIYLHFTMDDNPSLSEATKKRYEKMYSGLFFKRFVQGVWCAAEGAVYQEFTDNEEEFYVSRTNVPELNRIYVGVDFGGNKSKHAFCCVGFAEDFKNLYVLKCSEFDAAGMTPEGLYDCFNHFTEHICVKYGKIDEVRADSAEQTLIQGMRANCLPNIYNARKYRVLDRVRAEQALICERRLKIVREECEILGKAFRECMFDKKVREDRRLDDGTSDIDVLDAFEYAWERHIKRLMSGGEN